jgi:hypothetical protein
MDAEHIAEIYLRHFAAKQRDDEWAVTEVDNEVRRDPIGGWHVTRELVRKAESDEALAYVAAGPLEVEKRDIHDKCVSRRDGDLLFHPTVEYQFRATSNRSRSWPARPRHSCASIAVGIHRSLNFEFGSPLASKQ